jgi:putative membrane protein
MTPELLQLSLTIPLARAAAWVEPMRAAADLAQLATRGRMLLRRFNQRNQRERLLLMARKLYRFSSLLMLPALVLGLRLWLGCGITGGWMHAKLALVIAVLGYHHLCRSLLRRFEQLANTRSHRWFRVFNEASVLAFAAIVVLVVVKPF